MFASIFTWESVYNFFFNFNLITNKNKLIENVIYENSFIDRIILYSAASISFGGNVDYIIPILSYPYISNYIFNYFKQFYYVKKYYKLKNEYLIYLKVKLYYCFIKYLEPDVINISYIFDFSDQVFYNVIKNNHFLVLSKNLLFTYIMYILRSYESTYYFYKAIQLSYYYNSKYMFKTVDVKTAKDFLKNIFINKNYHNLNSIDYSNCFYSLCISKKADDETKFWQMMKINILYYFTLFNIIWGISWIFNFYTLILLSPINNFIIRLLLIYYVVTKIVYKKLVFQYIYFIHICLVSIISILSVGDLILTIYLFLYSFICLYFNITYFFIKFKLQKKRKIE